MAVAFSEKAWGELLATCNAHMKPAFDGKRTHRAYRRHIDFDWIPDFPNGLTQTHFPQINLSILRLCYSLLHASHHLDSKYPCGHLPK